MKIFSVLMVFLISIPILAQFETNYSFNLDGANSARTSASGFPTPNYITITGWIYLNSSGAQTLVAKNYNNSGFNSGQFEVFINSSNGLNFLTRVSGADIFSGSPGVLETGKWYFIVGKFDGSNVQSYINGILSSENSVSGVIDNTSPHPFSVGCQESTSGNKQNYFNGLIENLAIWNTSIDISIIKEWMHKEITTSHPYYGNLMAFYKFNGVNGNSYMWDASSNGRSLLITGNKNCYSTNLPPMCYIWGKLKDNYSEVRGIWSANLSNTSSILTITSSSLTGTTNALWGHNNKSITWTYFDIPKTVLRRLDRVWYTEKEGSPTGNFVFNTTGLTFSDGNKLRMLVDQDGSFYNAQIVNGVYSSENNTFTINGVNIGNNYYYTLAELTEGGGNSGPPADPPPWKWKSPKPQGNNLRAVTIINNNKFFAVGDGATIIYSENGGNTFEVSHFIENFSGNLNDCDCFPNSSNFGDNCIAVGDGGGYFKSSDYGRTWLYISDLGLPENYSIKDIHIIDENTAFIGGSEGRIYKTTNSGANWTAQTSPLTGSITSINFYNTQIGWAFDDFSYATTSNGGTSWQWKFNLPTGVLSSILLSETDGLIATNNGKIYKTTDFGTNWNEVYSGSNKINKLTKFGGGSLVLGVGNNSTIIKTTDNGSNWTSPTQMPSVINDILNTYIIDNKSLFVGKNGVIMTSDKFVNTVENITTGIMNGLSSAWITQTDCYAVVGRDKVYKSSDGGTNWQVAFNLGEAKLNALDFSDNSKGYIVGDDGVLKKTSDGGANFTDKSIGTGKNISNVKIDKSGSLLKNSQTLLILYVNTSTNQQIIAKSTDDGDSWTTIRSVSTSTEQIAKDLTFAGSNIFVCTKDGKILKSTNYGTDWNTTSFLYSTSFTKISFSNSSVGYVIGLKGIVYKTTDGGDSWLQKTNCSNDSLNNLSVMSSTLVIVSSTAGSIYETTDGGNTWKTSVTGLSSNINQLITVPKSKLINNSMSSDFIYYAIGDGGLILENTEGGIGLLPVELMFLFAKVNNNSVILNWQTANEINNYGFEIERAVTLRQAQSTGCNADDNQKEQNDNVTLSVSKGEQWLKLGFVQGYGNSNAPKSYTFTDNSAPVGKIQYRLKQIDNDGSFKYSDVIEVNVEAPATTEVFQNYPNPFNPSTSIKFNLSKESKVKIIVYDILGSVVKELVNAEKPAGSHIVYWNSDDNEGKKVASGVYFYELVVGNGLQPFRQIKKMNLVK